MLPAANRLRDAASFRTSVRRGRRAGARTLVVHLLDQADQDSSAEPTLSTPASGARVGFVVSKAVGNAVVRNRVKRRLRHLTRERVTTLPGRCVLVVRALPASASATSQELRGDLARCLERVST